MRVSVFYDHIREASRQKEKPEEEILRELYQAGVRGLEIWQPGQAAAGSLQFRDFWTGMWRKSFTGWRIQEIKRLYIPI